eukprot:GEMP01034538.1.p1 GENE.GEMP01034538.1~~GEMP01034538.1.p1  ORF type:complete len:327 (+),score=68.28 GEMP01034538.1:134-1114(+)
MDFERDHALFQATYPLKRACLPNRDEVWTYYDLGSPDAVTEPLVMVPGTCGTADSFFYQLDVLAGEGRGYRSIAVQYPPYHTLKEWAVGFELFLDTLRVKQVHLFGASLGAFLVQYYAMLYPKRVKSLILCNGFVDTKEFADKATFLPCVHLMPTVALRQLYLNTFPEFGIDITVKAANDWVARVILNQLDGYDLAARLTLNCTHAKIVNMQVPEDKITILDVMDKCMVPPEVRHQMVQFYPEAKYAPMKSGGDFPFLSRHSEVTLLIEVHLRNASDWRPRAPPVMPVVAASAQSKSRENKEEKKASAKKLPSRWRNPFEEPNAIV